MVKVDDIHYIHRVKKGDTEAFVHLVRRYERMVFTIVSKIVIRREEAEDITQEVFVKVFQSLSKFREDSEFSTWLYRIAYNTSISELRKRRHERMSFDDNYDILADDGIADSMSELTTEVQIECLEQVLAIMPPGDALLITMFYLNEHSVKQISDITGDSLSNVRVRLHRIRKYMSVEMNKLMQHEQ